MEDGRGKMEDVLSAIMKTILRSSQKGRQPAVIEPLLMRDRQV